MKNQTDYVEILTAKRNVKLRAFAIHLVLVTFVWILSLTGLYTHLMHVFLHLDPDEAVIYMAYLLGAWKIGGVLLFLTPALATCWEIHAAKK